MNLARTGFPTLLSGIHESKLFDVEQLTKKSLVTD